MTEHRPESRTKATPMPAAGQIWEDADPRSEGRRIRLVSITDTHAVAEPVVRRGFGHQAAPGRRSTRIRLNRLQPTNTGYFYVCTEEPTR